MSDDDEWIEEMVAGVRAKMYPHLSPAGPATRPKRRRAARSPTQDGLLDLTAAAAHLGIGVKLLRDHVRARRIKFIDVGKGGERRSIRFARTDLDEFTTNQRTSGEITPCPSSDRAARRSGISTSNTKVVAFTALQAARRNVKPKP